MAKIMLVEDDNNLRDIYAARLQAEGYEIVAARDGEEALALAVKEKPDLIISDVMMPKISGFDMLDILRTTPETKDTKVIMMTALSQAEDKTRAEQLGADRYLVKSQVTLEDVVKAVSEVMAGDPDIPNVTDTNAVQQPTPPLDVVTPTASPAMSAEPAVAPMPVVAEPSPQTPSAAVPAAAATLAASVPVTSFATAQTATPAAAPAVETTAPAPAPTVSSMPVVAAPDEPAAMQTTMPSPAPAAEPTPEPTAASTIAPAPTQTAPAAQTATPAAAPAESPTAPASGAAIVPDGVNPNDIAL